MADSSRIFQSDDPDLRRRMERIETNFQRLDSELQELEDVILDEKYIRSLADSQSDVIRKPR